eukprot:s6338_g6.t1
MGMYPEQGDSIFDRPPLPYAPAPTPWTDYVPGIYRASVRPAGIVHATNVVLFQVAVPHLKRLSLEARLEELGEDVGHFREMLHHLQQSEATILLCLNLRSGATADDPSYRAQQQLSLLLQRLQKWNEEVKSVDMEQLFEVSAIDARIEKTKTESAQATKKVEECQQQLLEAKDESQVLCEEKVAASAKIEQTLASRQSPSVGFWMSLRQRSISARVIRVPAKPRSPRPAKRQHTANSITSARDSEICEAISPRHKLCKDCLFLMLQVAPVMAKGVQRPPCRMQTRDELKGVTFMCFLVHPPCPVASLEGHTLKGTAACAGVGSDTASAC